MSTVYEHEGEQFKLERSDVVAYTNGATEGRVVAYIALPITTTTIREESDILWWAKASSEFSDWWADGDEYYKVYRVYVKEPYLHHVTEELLLVSGFYLRRSAGGDAYPSRNKVLGHDINEIWDDSDTPEHGAHV